MQTDRRIRLDSDLMKPMRESIDRALKGVFAVMGRTGSDEATINVKIDISKEESVLELATGEQRCVTVPKISYKVTTQTASKQEEKNDAVIGANILCRDDDGSWYVVPFEEAKGQISVFDAYDVV